MSRIVFKLKRIDDPNDTLQTSAIELGEHFTKTSDGSLFYKHHDTGLISNVSNGSGGGSVVVVQKFGLFITDIETLTAEATVNKTFMASQNNKILSNVESDGNLFRVYVTAFSTDTLYKPTVIIAGTPAILNEYSVGIFTGYADISITSASTTIHAIHASGTDVSFNFNRIYKPTILSNTAIISSYPITNSIQQTQIKENDPISLQIFSDQQFKAVRILDDTNNLVKQATFSFPPSSSTTVSLQGNSSYNSSLVGENLGIIFQIQSTNNTWSTIYNTKLAKSTPIDGIDFMKLSNLLPSLIITDSTEDDVVYPSLLDTLGSSNVTISQQFGVKNGQYIQIKSTATYYDSISYLNPLNHFTITSPTVFAATKTIQCSTATNNFNDVNFRIMLRRNSNGSFIIKDFIVKIVNTPAQYTIIKPSTRLQSGGFLNTAAKEYLFTITSDQVLHPDSVIEVNSPLATGIPVFKNSTWNKIDNSSSTNILIVKDNDDKVTFNLLNPEGYGLTGIPVNNIILNSSVELGGFSKRTFIIKTGENTHNIGTIVKDETKLRCTVFYYGNDLDNSTYINNTSNAVGKFTILNPDTIPGTVGDVWSNNDNLLELANKSYYTVELEEIP
jgi:hypothetical protein